MSKVRRSFIIFFILSTYVYATPVVVSDDTLLASAKQKILAMSNELYAKTGVSIVLYSKQTLQPDTILHYENSVAQSLQKPYVLVVLAAKEQKVDVVVSPDLQHIIDKNVILNTYIIPILGTTDEKNSANSRYSAALLNGIAEVADEVAAAKKITLATSIGNQSRDFMQGVRVVFYGIVILSLGIYIYRVIRRKRG